MTAPASLAVTVSVLAARAAVLLARVAAALASLVVAERDLLKIVDAVRAIVAGIGGELDRRDRVAAGPRPESALAPAADPNFVIWQLGQYLNAERAAVGKPPLSIDGRLCAVAARFAVELADRRRLTHERLSGIPGWQEVDAAVGRPVIAGEVVAAGPADAAAVVAFWMADAPHRAVLLGDFDAFGSGRARAWDSGAMPVWVVDLARLG